MFKIKCSRCLQIFYITQMFCAVSVKINMLLLGNAFLKKKPKKWYLWMLVPFISSFVYFFFFLTCLFWPIYMLWLFTLHVHPVPSFPSIARHSLFPKFRHVLLLLLWSWITYRLQLAVSVTRSYQFWKCDFWFQ